MPGVNPVAGKVHARGLPEQADRGAWKVTAGPLVGVMVIRYPATWLGSGDGGAHVTVASDPSVGLGTAATLMGGVLLQGIEQNRTTV